MDIKPKMLSADLEEIEVGKKAYSVTFAGPNEDLIIQEYLIQDFTLQTNMVKLVEILPPDNSNFTTQKFQEILASQIYINLQNIFDNLIRQLILLRDVSIPDKLNKIEDEYTKRFKFLNIEDDKFQVRSSEESEKI